MEATSETQMTDYCTEFILANWHTSDSQDPFHVPPPLFGGKATLIKLCMNEQKCLSSRTCLMVQKGTTKIAATKSNSLPTGLHTSHS